MTPAIKASLMILLLSGFCFSQPPVWLEKVLKIKPLESTEKDVEKLLGKPDEQSEDQWEYEIEGNYLTVTYSEGKCGVASEAEYNVEKGRVIEMTVRIEEEVLFKSLKFDLSEFKKKFSYDVDGLVNYTNTNKGFYFDVSGGRLQYINIDPGTRFSKLRCTPVPEEDDRPFYPTISVVKLSLSQNGVLVASWPEAPNSNKNSCLDGKALVEVAIETNIDEAEKLLEKKTDYTRRYRVSGGRIVGEGSNVVWDLSGVKAGAYTITADAAGGDPFWGRSMSIEICVIE